MASDADDLFTIAGRTLGLAPLNLSQARAAQQRNDRELRALLTHKRMMDAPLNDQRILTILHTLASYDTNNQTANISVGEREGRVYSGLVRQRHYGLSHGMGRSGDLVAEQPKATGSNILYRLTTSLTLDALHLIGLSSITRLIVSPVPTGQSLALVLMALRMRGGGKGSVVVMPRIDQKTCVKCVTSAGLRLVSVPNTVVGESVATDVAAIERTINDIGADNIVAILSITSCFAPRSADSVDAIAALCHRHGIAHVINNAYGLQSRLIVKMIERAARVGRVDCVVSSLDKNFLVPVSGAIIATVTDAATGAGAGLIDDIARLWSGRATLSHCIDLFITLLSMGKSQWMSLLSDREDHYRRLTAILATIAEKFQLRLLTIEKNDIGLALSLPATKTKTQISLLGSMLFTRGVTGCRAVHHSDAFGPHCDGYHSSFLAMAVAIGMRSDECDEFGTRLDKTLARWLKKTAES